MLERRNEIPIYPEAHQEAHPRIPSIYIDQRKNQIKSNKKMRKHTILRPTVIILKFANFSETRNITHGGGFTCAEEARISTRHRNEKVF